MKWKQISSELLLRTAIFRIFKTRFRSEFSGKEGEFDVLEAKDWVNVVALTEASEVIMVEQFRFGVGELTLEFPAGAIEAGQSPLSAAERELSEETGGECAAILQTGSCRPNPAFLGNTCFHFLATGVKLGKEQKLDIFEEITIKLFSIAEVEAMIASGKISHSLSVAAWYFYKHPQS